MKKRRRKISKIIFLLLLVLPTELYALRVPLNNYDRLRKTMEWTIRKPSNKEIEKRAYQIWQERGGNAEDNWREAERELTTKATVWVFDVVKDPIEETILTIIAHDRYDFMHLRAYLQGLRGTVRSGL